jgi:hypothetical protein
MVGGLVLFCGTTMDAALTSQEIYKIAEGSTVHLGFTDAKGNRWTGSGFVIRDGHIATNHHVVDNMWIGGAKLVGREEIYPVEIILDTDKERDLAIIKVTGIDAPALPLGDSDTVRIGDKVYITSNPQGLEGSFLEGIISAIRGGPSDKFFQMTAPISQGSSGGPVFNERGEVIGVSFVTLRDGQNLNSATPINYLKVLANIPVTPTPFQPKPVTPKIDLLPVEPQPSKPQVDPFPVEPKPVKPKVNPPPVVLQPTKPQVNQAPVRPKSANSQVNPPKPAPPKPRPRYAMLDKGIKLYEQAKYSEAIDVLSSVIQELADSEQQAEAHLYLGCSKWGSGEGSDKVRKHFEESIRYNPAQKLPPRIGEDHPIFSGLLEETRRKLTGELTVISLLPQTVIWIEGNNTDRKVLGTGIVKRRLFRGDYIVEGIYAGISKRKTITIEPNRHKEIDLEIPPIMQHDSPAMAFVGEIIPLTLNLITSKGPKEVIIRYKTYDREGNKLEQNNQKMRLWERQSASSTWIYKVGLASQKYVNSIKYYIEIEYESHLRFRQPETPDHNYQIAIIEDQPPTINLLSPPEGAKFTVNQQITIRAEVTDDSFVKEVYVHFSPANSQKLTEEDDSGIHTIDITVSEAGYLRYYLTATDEAGNKGESESRQIEIKTAIDDGGNGGRAESEPVEIKTTTDDGEDASTVESKPVEIEQGEEPEEAEPRDPHVTIPADSPEAPPLMSPIYPMYQGVWVSVASNNSSLLDWEGDKMFRFAYLREGKHQPTLGAQLEFSHSSNANVSAMVQWGPAVGKSSVAFTLLGGITEYEVTSWNGETHMTPLFGAGLKLYPQDTMAIDATTSIKLRSDFDAPSLYHYEIGVRVYITPRLNLRAGYGQLYLGEQDITVMQIGLGYTF